MNWALLLKPDNQNSWGLYFIPNSFSYTNPQTRVERKNNREEAYGNVTIHAYNKKIEEYGKQMASATTTTYVMIFKVPKE